MWSSGARTAAFHCLGADSGKVHVQEVKNKGLVGGGFIPSRDSWDVSTECFCLLQATMHLCHSCPVFFHIKAPYCALCPVPTFFKQQQRVSLVCEPRRKVHRSLVWQSNTVVIAAMLNLLPGDSDNIPALKVFLSQAVLQEAVNTGLPRISECEKAVLI